MYAKTNCRRRLGRGFAPSVGPFGGWVLYGVTVIGETFVSGGARFCLGFAGTFLARQVMHCPLGPPLGGEAAALLPILWSLAALGVPGSSWWWRRRLGARAAGEQEERALEMALEGLGADRSYLARTWVLDDPLPNAWVRGAALVVSRGLLEDEHRLIGALGHELFHLSGSDGPITEALARLALWQSSRIGYEDEGGSREGIVVALAWGAVRLLVAAAGRRPVWQALSPIWAAYWRAREYRADAHAVELGVGADLVSYLEGLPQAVDRPQAGVLRCGFEHPPVALRISCLRALLDAG